MSTLREFLRDLAIDPEKLAGFVRDPVPAMDAAALDERSRRVLFSGSPTAMWQLLHGRLADDFPVGTPKVSTSVSQRGSLVVVGTGIRTVGQLTPEAITHIKESEAVCYLVADPIAEDVIKFLNPIGAVSLMGHYGDGVSRKTSYEAMVQQIIGNVRSGLKTCAVFYGHPGVFAYPSHESIRRARSEGYMARMLPAVSAEDCLFADLGIDPAVSGCQSFECTDFLLHDRAVDTSSQLILWQVGVVGDMTYRRAGYSVGPMFEILKGRLFQLFGADHHGFIYEAAILPGLAPAINRVAMSHLSPELVTANSTLYIPPFRKSTINRNVAAVMGVLQWPPSVETP